MDEEVYSIYSCSGATVTAVFIQRIFLPCVPRSLKGHHGILHYLPDTTAIMVACKTLSKDQPHCLEHLLYRTHRSIQAYTLYLPRVGKSALNSSKILRSHCQTISAPAIHSQRIGAIYTCRRWGFRLQRSAINIKAFSFPYGRTKAGEWNVLRILTLAGFGVRPLPHNISAVSKRRHWDPILRSRK